MCDEKTSTNYWIGKLERTHASLETNLKTTSGEYQRQWFKYLQLTVLNYTTTYHVILGCEPSGIFHGRILFNILFLKLGPKSNPKVLSTTDFADKIPDEMKMLIDFTNENIMKFYFNVKSNMIKTPKRRQ